MIITKMFIPLMLLALVLAVSSREIKCVVREREALMRFKQGITDDYGVLSSWGSDEVDCCKWKGVRCGNATGHVTGILLQGDDDYYSPIGGNITSSLLDLQFLEHLDLSNNNFGGIQIPRFFGSFENLRILNLRQSSFAGRVPPQFGNLSTLVRLDLFQNNVWSENLDWLSHLTLLSELDLSGANISDSNWLYSVMKLRSLQQLSLSGCDLQDVTPSTSHLFINSSLLQSLSDLDLPNNGLTRSTFDWLFNLTSLVTINLSFNQLDGPIPDSFERLRFLEELDLSINTLTHGVPRSLASLSHLRNLFIFSNKLGESLEGLFGNDSCRVMVSLQQVLLSFNQIKGSVPQVGACSNLRYLDLGNNNLSGEVPLSLGHLSKLVFVSFTFNSLEGVISESHLEKLHSLKQLTFSYNSLTLKITPTWIPPFQLYTLQLASCRMGPSFPAWLQTQTNLSSLDISNAAISDKVPKWLWSLSHRVNISNNHLLGHTPRRLTSESVDASSNQLSGQLPLLQPNTSVLILRNNLFSDSISSICSVPYDSLVLLDLSGNQLFGALPNCWRNMTELMILNLSNNKFFGEIPQSLGSLLNLQTLQLRGNSLSGGLPLSLKNCGLLQLIDVGDNRLTGVIPAWLGTSFYTSMKYLILSENGFHGRIPLEICSLNEIQLLDLSRNNISGEIPSCFHNFTSLADKSTNTSSSSTIQVVVAEGYINYALVQWKGKKAEYRQTLGLLKLIDLSSNKLVGKIPKATSSLKGLISLNLSRNGLTGSIDSEINHMEMLEVLDLSRNLLSGEIPLGLAQLSYLSILDLSSNDLSGKIPSGAQLQGFDESAYAGNERLCGKPLIKICEADINSGGEEKEEEEEGGGWFMRLSFMQGFGISMMFGFILGFWGVFGSLVVKKSWREAFFGCLDAAADWMCVKTILHLTKFKRICMN